MLEDGMIFQGLNVNGNSRGFLAKITTAIICLIHNGKIGIATWKTKKMEMFVDRMESQERRDSGYLPKLRSRSL